MSVSSAWERRNDLIEGVGAADLDDVDDGRRPRRDGVPVGRGTGGGRTSVSTTISGSPNLSFGSRGLATATRTRSRSPLRRSSTGRQS